MRRRIAVTVLGAAWLAAAAGALFLAYLAGPRTEEAVARLHRPTPAARPVRDLPYAGLINGAARRAGLPPALVAAVVAAESRFEPRAVSARGARGLMQIMSDTWREMAPHPLCPPDAGERCIFHPAANLDAGSRYLRRLIDRFDGNIAVALAAYNAGPTHIQTAGRTRRYAQTDRYVGQVALARDQMDRSGTLPPGWRIALTAVGAWGRIRVPLAVAVAVPPLLLLGRALRARRHRNPRSLPTRRAG